MRLPSKVFTYEESVISKFPVVLTHLLNESLSPRELYVVLEGKTEDISEFLVLLDCLYALGKIDYENETGKLRYVG